jgi:adenine-specific DNA-methyltransferase
MAKKKPAAASTPVEVIKHHDSRKNIPTEELRDFLDESQPQTLLYPRDTTLDPQLVWKGKDEQDRQPLEVPVVPIYIQEKIHPQALIEDFQNRHIPQPAKRQLDLFADFNGIDGFDKKIDFYQHNQHWSNRMILGDSLAVMTSLAEKEGLRGQVQTIYIDPPYGIKFGSNWQVSTRKRDVKDGSVTDATRQPEQVRAFRDTWELGIHSYLAYLRDRLTAARELLTESGSVFVQIGDENLHLVRSIMDEVFGTENFCRLITFKKTAGDTSLVLPAMCDYIVWYAKSLDKMKYRPVLIPKEIGADSGNSYQYVELPSGATRRLTDDERTGAVNLPDGSEFFASADLKREGFSGTATFEYTFEGVKYFCGGDKQWKTTKEGLDKLAAVGWLYPVNGTLRYKRYLKDFAASHIGNMWTDTETGSFLDSKVYVVQTGAKVIQRCLLMTTDPGDLVLDPTCGSGTTAYVAEQWGRRWITCDTSRVALALARTRLMTAKFPYYLLADSPDGIEKEAELTGQRPPTYKTKDDIRKGFVYKRVPHVTLKSIANNPEIKEGMTREQIDAAIARHADTETLFDKPYEDKQRLRVTGPFTVESLSPHRRLTVAKTKERNERLAVREYGAGQFGNVIIENLKRAGIQSRNKTERLKFDTLEPYSGEWVHAAGTYTDTHGQERRVAVCIGPQYGTVGPGLVQEAAKEAVKGIGFDMLYVCGFSFDPHVNEETTRYGKLNVQICRMNPDLSMGDDLLKKTGAGNLFTVFGEPDIIIRTVGGKVLHAPVDAAPAEKPAKGAKSIKKDAAPAGNPDDLIVEVRGVDVYDPTTGEIRSQTTDDIACWFIDTNYDGESFFVRLAYFTGAGDPYDKLKRSLKAEIDEAAWSELYQTTSQPFPRPTPKVIGKTPQIAVKVINHYGDEVLKVYSVK